MAEDRLAAEAQTEASLENLRAAPGRCNSGREA